MAHGHGPQRGFATTGGGGAAAGGAAGCGVGCGQCDDAGVEVMSYAGAAHGSYVQETTYMYVGKGQGDFESVTVAPTSNWCVIIGGGGGVLALLLLLLLLLWPTEPATTTILFDCNEGFANWQSAWSPDKQSWCCNTAGLGCPTPTTQRPYVEPPSPPPPPPPAPRFVWAPPPQPATAAPLNECQMGGLNTWTMEKKAYCCLHYRNGCDTQAPPPAPVPFDCNAGWANWQAGWSVPKKIWCCQSAGRGCAPTPPLMPFDCNAGFDNWVAGWSEPKKQWCCQNGGRGCQTAALPFDCNAGFDNWVAGWSVPKKQWCCQHAGRGCAQAAGGCA